MTTTLEQQATTGSGTQADEHTDFSNAVEAFDLRAHTDAPLRLEGEFHFSAPPHELFPRLTDPKAIAGWFGMVRGGHLDHSASCNQGEWGSGSKRFCRSTMGTLEETVYSYEAPYVTAYNVRNWSMPMENHCAVMFVEPTPDGGTKLTWRHYFNDKGRIIRHFIPKVMARLINVGMSNLGNEMGGHGGTMKVIDLPTEPVLAGLSPAEAPR